MLRLKFLPAALVVAISLAGCSKKQETAVADQTKGHAEKTQPDTPAPANPAAQPTENPAVGFNSPSDGSPEALEQTAAPESTVGTNSPVATARAAGLEPAELITFFPPFYPLSLRMQGIEGRIDLRMVVSKTGEVTDVAVVKATAPQFREFAVEAAKCWKFAPAMQNGTPVGTIVTIPVPFVSEFGSGVLTANSPLAGLTFLDGTYYQTDDNGRYTPANQALTPLVRRQPSFTPPPDNTEPLRATLMFTVNEEGQVLDPKIVDSTNAEFGEAAAEAVRFWQFIPRIKNGKPSSSQVKLPIVFGSEDQAG